MKPGLAWHQQPRRSEELTAEVEAGMGQTDVKREDVRLEGGVVVEEVEEELMTFKRIEREEDRKREEEKERVENRS